MIYNISHYLRFLSGRLIFNKIFLPQLIFDGLELVSLIRNLSESLMEDFFSHLEDLAITSSLFSPLLLASVIGAAVWVTL